MLGYFILGILFIFVGIPILEDLVSMFNSFSQYIVYKIAFKIYYIKKQLGIDTQQEDNEKKSFPIGFQYTEAVGEQINFEQQEEEEDEE